MKRFNLRHFLKVYLNPIKGAGNLKMYSVAQLLISHISETQHVPQITP
ncbi:MAG: hypothetical protein SPK90_06845 [Bacteroidales bacterium]|nr:hypothetical protein [Bacteroidales bacterium]